MGKPRSPSRVAYTRAVEAAYRAMWVSWCNAPVADH